MAGCSRPSARRAKVPTVGSIVSAGANPHLPRSIPEPTPSPAQQICSHPRRWYRGFESGLLQRRVRRTSRRGRTACGHQRCRGVCEGMGLSCAVAVGGEPSGRIDVTRCTAARLWVASSQVDGVDQRLPAASAHLDAMPFGGTRSLLRCRACGRRAASSISPSVPLLPAAGAVAAPVCREALEYPPPPTRRRRHSGLTVAFNWPTVYFANAFSPIKLSSGEDFGD